MALYSIGVRTTSGTTGTAAWEIRSSSTDRLFIVEIGIFLAAATASTYGLGRPAAIGITPTSPVTVQAEDPSLEVRFGHLVEATSPDVGDEILRDVGRQSVGVDLDELDEFLSDHDDTFPEGPSGSPSVTED